MDARLLTGPLAQAARRHEPGGKCGVSQLVICAGRRSGQMTSPGPPCASQPGGSGRFQNKCEMKLPWDPRLRELVALAMLAAFGCGFALAQGHFLFVGIFAAASAVTIIEAIGRLR